MKILHRYILTPWDVTKREKFKRNEHLVSMCGPFKLMVSSSIANLVNDIIDNNIKITIVFLKN